MTEEERKAAEAALRARIVAAETLQVTQMEKMITEGDVPIANAYVAYAARYVTALENAPLPPIGPFSVPGLMLE